VFEWDKILSLEGNTAPFLLYSYARARGIQRKGGVEIPTVSTLEILEPTEKELAMLLLQFPMAVQSAQTSHRPNMLCEYLFDVASSFNRFYFANPVLTASEEQVKQARLALVESMLRVMKKGLDILGLIALDRM
jgi:arginyl-tRNA synthetase